MLAPLFLPVRLREQVFLPACSPARVYIISFVGKGEGGGLGLQNSSKSLRCAPAIFWSSSPALGRDGYWILALQLLLYVVEEWKKCETLSY